MADKPKKPSRAIWRGEWYYRSGKTTGTPPSWRNRRTGEIRKMPPNQKPPKVPQNKDSKETKQKFSKIFDKTKKAKDIEPIEKHSYSFDKFLTKRNKQS